MASKNNLAVSSPDPFHRWANRGRRSQQGCKGVPNCKVSWATYIQYSCQLASSQLPVQWTYLWPGNGRCYQDQVDNYVCAPALRILTSNSKLQWRGHQCLAFCQNPFSLVGLYAWNTHLEFLVCTVLSSSLVTNQNAGWIYSHAEHTSCLRCLLKWP